MTPSEKRKLVASAEYEQLREYAQEVGCPACNAVIGEPCKNRYGDVLPMEHPQRIKKAEELRGRGVTECTCCQFERLTAKQRAVTPWPEEQVVCKRHRGLYEEIEEALGMAEWYEAYGEARTAGAGHAEARKIANERMEAR